jgi:penicillin-binding protein 2
MQKFLEKIRIFVLVALIFTATALTFIRLMKIQLVEGEELLALSISRTSGSQTIEAPRGEIVDINGDVVVQNRVGYNVVIDYSFFPKDKQVQNEIILRVAPLEYMASTQCPNALTGTWGS